VTVNKLTGSFSRKKPCVRPTANGREITGRVRPEYLRTSSISSRYVKTGKDLKSGRLTRRAGPTFGATRFDDLAVHLLPNFRVAASDDLNRTGDVGDGDGLEAGRSAAEDRKKREELCEGSESL
jgi:hypothetical protein